MPFIKACRAPDLSIGDTPILATYLLNVVFRGSSPANPDLRSHVTNYIRATDRAIEEYQRARQLLIDYIGSNNRTLLLFRALSHFETCIHYVKRAHRLFETLRRHPEGPVIEKVAGKILERYSLQITPLRDTIEHIDERIVKGEIAEGAPIALFINTDGDQLEIGQHTVSLIDLAAALRRLHEFGSIFADTKIAFRSASPNTR